MNSLPTGRNAIGFGLSGLLVAASASGCDLLSTDPAGESDAGAEPSEKGEQAPRLAEQVRAGNLPPVAERLPANPPVVEPVERIGRYGGTWPSALLGPADLPWLNSLCMERMVRWEADMAEILPNVAEGVETNDDGTEFIFSLREGMRWSDGEPFTADDVVFAQNDVFNNSDLYPVPPDPPRVAERIDDNTVAIRFEAPAPLYLLRNGADGLIDKPLHYLGQFHEDVNDEIADVLEQEGAQDWVDLFQQKADLWQNGDLPRLHPWIPTVPLGEGSRVTFERNPYYWKVDPDGSQLYIDELDIDVIDDVEVIMLRALEGQIDMTYRHINTLGNKPILAEGRERGDYRMFDTEPAIMNETLLIFNLTHQDPVKREIFNNRDFRVGLSHAIDREQISTAVFHGQSEPWQAAPRPESFFFDEEYAKQYTEYDPDLANQYLDDAGYAERNGSGVRLGPDGNPISFTLVFSRGSRAEPSDTLELVEGYWREVGIDAHVQFIDRSLIAVRNEANDFDMFAWEATVD